jgi:hypothetical protein
VAAGEDPVERLAGRCAIQPGEQSRRDLAFDHRHRRHVLTDHLRDQREIEERTTPSAAGLVDGHRYRTELLEPRPQCRVEPEGLRGPHRLRRAMLAQHCRHRLDQLRLLIVKSEVHAERIAFSHCANVGPLTVSFTRGQRNSFELR